MLYHLLKILDLGGLILYFGSVKFFRHIILAILGLMIIVPTTISIVLLLEIHNLKSESIYTNNAKPVDLVDDIGSEVIEDKDQSNNDKENNEEPTKPISDITESLPYQKLYPKLYAENKDIAYTESDEKIIYLTFDDGPSENTLKILDILDEYQIKATFFVILKKDDFSANIYKEIVKRGHTLAIHSASHNYTKIYKSVESFLEDMNKIHNYIYDLTNINANLYRFPGGSINSYNSQIYQEIIAEMFRRGFIYHDWNVSSCDTVKGSTKEKVYNNVVSNVEKHDKSIVLFHDSEYKAQVVSALPSIIEDLSKDGYKFIKLDSSVKPYSFSYSN